MRSLYLAYVIGTGAKAAETRSNSQQPARQGCKDPETGEWAMGETQVGSVQTEQIPPAGGAKQP